MSKIVSILAATAIAGTTLMAASSADARPGYRGGYQAGGYGYRRRGGNGGLGAALAVGAAATIIGGAIVANQYRRSDQGYGYYDRPAYGAYGGPAYGYYGY